MNQADRESAYVDYVTARRAHLRRIAYALCGDWHRADDLLQIALVKLYVAWPRVRRSGSEDAYVRRILVRASIDESRRPWRRERATEDLPDLPAAEPTGVEDRAALFDALQALPAQQRAAVVLRHWLGLSVAETAAELGSTRARSRATPRAASPALRLTLEPSETGIVEFFEVPARAADASYIPRARSDPWGISLKLRLGAAVLLAALAPFTAATAPAAYSVCHTRS